jgi:hypothetical protein
MILRHDHDILDMQNKYLTLLILRLMLFQIVKEHHETGARLMASIQLSVRQERARR